VADVRMTELDRASVSPPVVVANRRTDASLIAASRRDPEAFEELFDRYWPGLHAFCCNRAGAAGEDVAVHGLTDGERDALVLWAWADLQYSEIAQALDVPLGTVRSPVPARLRLA
jgi:DNA-directed RNA polymerase specialized sigma24 family protein